MRMVVALGGNALARRGEEISAETLWRNLDTVVPQLAALADGNELVVTHGNGPQVGVLELQNLSYRKVAPYPLDILGAESQGMIGYPLQACLRNALPEGRQVATVLTTTQVSREDPAFLLPSKFVGPIMTEGAARKAEQKRGWQIRADGEHYRRVVPSPAPILIRETEAVEFLLTRGYVVVAAGGGGVPVVIEEGAERGVEGVVDKDLASFVLARDLGADVLLILTDADYVAADWGLPTQRPILRAHPDALADMSFAAGSMAPKVEAASLFARGGGTALIGPLDDVAGTLSGRTGTRIVAEPGLTVEWGV